MIQFFKDSFRDFKHIVWPTREETKKYFFIVLAILITFGIYLFIASVLFGQIIFSLEKIVK